MHYVIGDIHNEAKKLDNILEQIQLTSDDEVIVLGDLFDRGNEPDPVGVYLMITALQGRFIWIRGNHDQWLADYIKKYFSLAEKERKKLFSYTYNSFDLIKQRMTEVDMLNLANTILKLPLQTELDIGGKKYLFAHAMTSNPFKSEINDYYMMGNWALDLFFIEGIEGYISLCGHTPTGTLQMEKPGRYLEKDKNSIWVNQKENVYLLDCGCGFASGKLACLCLETGERFYSKKIIFQNSE